MLTPAYAPTATERVLPRLALDFTTASLDPRVTVARALNTATCVNSSGLITGVNANLPRFDYDTTTLSCKGILIEETRSNLILRSEEIDQSSWSKINITVSTDAIASPSGAVNADLSIATTTSGQHRVDQTPVSSAGAQVFSAFIKPFGYRWASLRIGSSGRTFDLQNGTVGTTGTLSATISAFPNGWYRCTIYAPSASANDICRINIENSDSIGSVFSGDGTSGIYLWGAQLEAGAFATSYIPTTTTSLTRNADVVSMTGTNFSSWYNASEGAFVVTANTTRISARTLTVSAGTIANQLWVQAGSTGENVLQVYTSSAFVAKIGVLPSTADKKIAVAFKANSFAAAIGGGSVATNNTGTYPSYDRIFIGSNYNGSGAFLNGTMGSLLFYPQRIINAEVQAFSK